MLRILLPAAVLFALSACGEPSSPPTNDQAVTDTAPIPLGEAGRAKGVEFTVTKVATTSSIGPDGLGTAAGEGETFVVVDYTLKNIGTAPMNLMDRPSIKLMDGGGQTYAVDDLASGLSAALMKDPSGMGADLNPNVSAKAKTAWKVDKATFDKASWKVVVGSDPQLTFALK